eukprot:6744498-Pyramimonas_sp.AAC.1
MAIISSSVRVGAGVATSSPPYKVVHPGILGTLGAAEEEEERSPTSIVFALGAWVCVSSGSAPGVATGAISQI